MRLLYIGAHPTIKIINDSNGRIDSLYRDDEALIRGLRTISGNTVEVITSPDIASFPSNKLYYFGHYSEKDNVYMVSLLNIPIVKQIWSLVALTYKASKIISRSNENVKVFLPYVVLKHVMVGTILKTLYRRKVQVCIVVPDIFFPRDAIGKRLNRYAEKLAGKFDYFVLYTKQMSDYLKISEKPQVVIEGFHEVVDCKANFSQDKPFIVLYSGALNVEYGIIRLLDAIKFIQIKDIELHLYGRGNGVPRIDIDASFDKRIKYFGLVSKEKAIKALQTASVLINPRCGTDGEYVEYSFPSKDIDYLASGKPCILCKLPGMPTEYYGHFIDAGNGDAPSLAKAIEEAYKMSSPERELLAKNAFEFIKDRMDIHKQAYTIIDMIINADNG